MRTGIGAPAEFLQALGKAGDEEGLDRGEVLTFIDGDAVPWEAGGGETGQLLNGGPGEMEIGEEAGSESAAGLFQTGGGGVGEFSGRGTGEAYTAGDIVAIVHSLRTGGGESADAGG